MGRQDLVKNIVGLFVLFLLQVLVFKDLVLFNNAFCFAYILIFLLLPLEMAPVAQLLIGFSVGLAVDSFYNYAGLNAAASTLLVFLKIYWLQALTPSGGYDIGARIDVKSQGLEWFVTFSYPLILIHSLFLFFVEAGGFGLFWSTLGKAFYSSIFTLAIILIIQYLFFKKVR